MREIEVKAKLIDTVGFLKATEKLGIHFTDAVTQDDTTYESKLSYTDPAWSIFRIRKQAGNKILTMKHKASSRSRDNYEYETIVADEGQIIKMLERLGYTHGVFISKHRRNAQYNGLELCLDVIDGLGTFVEVEQLADDKADVDLIQAELWSLLKKLGISDSDRVHKGYDTLMREMKANA